MKTILITLFLCFAVSNASAGWVALQGEVNINVTQCNGTPCTVASFKARNNSSHKSMSCKGYVFGKEPNGNVVNVWVDGTFTPGQWVEGYVYAVQPRYFVDAWSNIKCLI